jgi:hypothetical protein
MWAFHKRADRAATLLKKRIINEIVMIIKIKEKIVLLYFVFFWRFKHRSKVSISEISILLHSLGEDDENVRDALLGVEMCAKLVVIREIFDELGVTIVITPFRVRPLFSQWANVLVLSIAPLEKDRQKFFKYLFAANLITELHRISIRQGRSHLKSYLMNPEEAGVEFLMDQNVDGLITE